MVPSLEAPVSTPVRPPTFITHPPRKVAFLCIHNSSRSQMAEGFARAMAPRGVEVWSAGTSPTRVHPAALQVMKEVGVDLSAHTSKRLEDIPWAEADTIVTLCGEAEEACPVVAGDVRRVHWPLPDPSAAPEESLLEAFREVRDEIRWRISSLWPAGDQAPERPGLPRG
uniref:Arsenate reductase ArsC n=1 Tax=Eiseniibacteriota bacterium TaxID=2212470 RepID=A0A832MJQ2_UNCEI